MSPPPSSAKPADGPLEFVKNLLLGGTSGCIAKTLCAPLERVKIVLQTQAAGAASTQYATMLDAGRGIVRDQGVLGLWNGNLTNCARYFPTQAMNFAFKERYQKLFIRPREEVGFGMWFAGFLAAGGAAGATALTVVYPLEFAYTRLAADTGTVKQFPGGLPDVLRSIARTDGVLGLYRGFAPSVAGIIVYRAGYFGFYDAGKQLLFQDGGKDTSIVLKFGLAMGVDISAAVLAYPLDTVRRRLMMQSGKAAGEVQYTSALGCVRHIVRHEGGVLALYKGCFANNVRAIASALVLVLYDEIKKYV